MKSVHRYLLLTLICSLVAGSILTAALVYWNARVEIDELYNKNMQEIAQLLQHEMGERMQLYKTRTDNRDTKLTGEEEILIQIWQPKGKLLYSSYPSISLPLQSRTGQFTAEFRGASWHIYRTNTGSIVIQLAQPYKARNLFVREMALNMLYPMLAQIPLISLFIWFAVSKSLVPLRRISRAIQRRSAASLAPLTIHHIPTEIQPMVTELNGLLGRLETALSSQQRFTLDAAHELRTPLAAIKLQLGNLDRAQDAAERQAALAKLHRGIDRASHLVQQLLAFARLEPEGVKQHGVFDVAPLIHEAIETYAEIAFEKKIDLGLTRIESVRVTGDAIQIRMTLDNLIDNAIRYTPRGGKVDVAVYADRGEAVIEVKDSGIGIAKDQQDRIFERFYRVMGTQTDGTGLGLAIVKNIIEVHGGRILVTDGIENKGVGFAICLPLAD